MKKIRSIPFVLDRYRLANDVLAHRADMGITQAELAEFTTCSQATIGRIENADSVKIGMRHFLSICNALDLDPRWYFVLGE